MKAARILEAAGHAVHVTDTDAHIEYANPAFERITGHSASEVLDLTPATLDSGVHDESHFEALWNTTGVGDVWTAVITNRGLASTPTGQLIAPLTDGENDVRTAMQTDALDHGRDTGLWLVSWVISRPDSCSSHQK